MFWSIYCWIIDSPSALKMRSYCALIAAKSSWTSAIGTCWYRSEIRLISSFIPSFKPLRISVPSVDLRSSCSCSSRSSISLSHVSFFSHCRMIISISLDSLASSEAFRTILLSYIFTTWIRLIWSFKYFIMYSAVSWLMREMRADTDENCRLAAFKSCESFPICSISW